MLAKVLANSGSSLRRRAPNIVICVTYHVDVTNVTLFRVKRTLAHVDSSLRVESSRSEKPECANKFVSKGTLIEMLIITQCTY